MKFTIVLLLGFLLSCSITPKQVYKASGETATLLDETKPIKAVFLSQYVENTDQVKIDDQFAATVKIAKAVLPVLKADQKLYFVGESRGFERLVHNLSELPPQLAHIDARPYQWMQDLFEFGHSQEELISFVSYGNHSMLDTVASVMKTAEVGSEQRIHMLTANAVHGTVGGNFERWPYSVGVIGSSDFVSESAALAFSHQFFSKQDKIIVLPTSWLNIGHMDEVVRLVRYQQGAKCELTFLINDTSLALKLLQKSKDLYFLDEMEYGQSRFSEIGTMKEICAHDQYKCSTGLLNSKALDIFKGNKEMSLVLAEVNKSFSEIKKKITTAYKEQNPSCKVSFVTAPMLYLASIKDNKIQNRSARAVFPSLTNGLLINNKYIVADPGNLNFRRNFTETMKKLSIEVIYVPLGKELFTGSQWDGHVHCMTQVLRGK